MYSRDFVTSTSLQAYRAKEIFQKFLALHRPSSRCLVFIYGNSGLDTFKVCLAAQTITPYFYAFKKFAMAYNLLQGKKGIIFGALDEKSIAWRTALRCHEEGAQLVLSNAPVALRMGEIKKLSDAVGAPVIGADVVNMDDLKKLFEESMKHFGGGIDFILHSIGMSLNVRKGKHYTEIDYGFNQKSLDISAMSLHRVLRTAWELDALNEWGSVVALSYIAAQRVFPDYNEMADAKALLESVARSFGYHYGVKKNVRVNTISQSPS